MVNWVDIFGPLAGIYGRGIEQYFMRPDRTTLISEHKFNESVNGGKNTLHKEALTTYQDRSMTSNQSDTDVRSYRRESRH